MSKALAQRTEFYSVWQKFITTGATEGIPEDIKASWKRCREMGIDPIKDITPVEINQEFVKKQIDEHIDLHHLLQSHYKYIEKNFDFAPFAILFSDADGYVLSLSGHDEILNLLERGSVKTGLSLNESVIGTTAPGISLIEGKPSTVIAEGHYSHLFHWASCFAIPVFDHKKNIVGSLDFTTTTEYRKKLEYLIPYLWSIANSLQFEFFLKKKLQQLELFDSYFHSTFEYADKILILVSRRGDIIKLNTNAQVSFGINPNEFIDRNVRELLEIDSKFNLLLNKPQVVKLAYSDSGRSELFSAESIPIFDKSGNEIAYLLKLEKEKAGVTMIGKGSSTTRYDFKDIIGQSKQILDVINKAKKAAKTQSIVLIEGETGTGKELFAQAIHNASQYCNGPFVAINCCAIPKELVESELFGYEKGAYTDAKKEGSIGKFELANGGTLLLDEIHAMDISAQMKILRIIEDRQVTKVGGKYPIPLNIRIIVASTKNLEDEVEKGNFLSPLFFRLNVVRLYIPVLRERKEDIPFLVNYFVKELNQKFNRSIKGIEPEALKVLFQYSWPGNIRELKNCIECAFNFCDGELITLKDLNLTDKIMTKSKEGAKTGQTIEDITKKLLVESLNRYGNVKKAADSLGIAISTFYRKMKKFDLSK
jgi:transcriptional regulator with PAS, ATPase and Fis domain